MYVPPDFNSGSTYQYTGYHHPHEEGVTYSNSDFEDIFRKQYFVPEYVGYLYPNLTRDEIKIITSKLMQDDDLIQAGVFYMRAKAILMMLEWREEFLDEFLEQVKKKSAVLKRMKLLDVDCVDNIPDRTTLEYTLEQMRILSQLYIINIIKCQLEGVKCYEQLHRHTKAFLEGMKTFNTNYNKKLPMLGWQMWTIPFLTNLGSALCGMGDFVVATEKLYKKTFM